MITDYQKCPKCFHRKHILNVPFYPTSKMTTGSSVDSVMNMALNAKKSGAVYTVEEGLDHVCREMDHRRIETDWQGDDFGKFKDDAIAATKLLIEQVVPNISPLEVQLPFTIQTNLEFDIEGTIDYLDANGFVRDLKVTTRQGLNGYSINDNIQTACYTIAAQGLENFTPKGFILDRVVRPTKTLPAEYHPLEGVVTQNDIKEFWDAARDVWNGIQKEVFNRTYAGSFYCHCKKHTEKAS
jgi:hypothetical protein